VVIVGGGFGGLSAARALARAPAEVVVVDARNHHTFQPLLYQVATAALSPAEIAWPIRHLLRRQKNARVLLARAECVDLVGRRLLTDAGPLAYDWLVLAPGASHAYFGHDEWAAFAPGLKSLEDAVSIRRRILMAFEEAERSEDATAHAALLTFVVVGGGPTGVEMAGAIAEVAHEALLREFDRIDPSTARVVLIEAGPRVLPAFPEDLAAYAVRHLHGMGVEVMTNTRVTGFDAGGVILEHGRIDAATRVWGAGVQAAPLARTLEAEHDRAGRVLVAADLSLPAHPEVFIVGDAAAATSQGKPVPGIAPAAKQMGAYVGRVIAARLAGKAPPAPFRYRHEGDLATIGRNAAVLRLRGVRLHGFLAWMFWGVAHVYFLIGVRNRVAVALDWFWSYLTRQRSARLITGLPAD
jgi:NADH dehydrogenase